MVINAKDLKPGRTIEMDGNLYNVVASSQAKTLFGGARIKVKMKHLITRDISEKLFKPGDEIDDAKIEIKEMQFLYKSGRVYSFMDNETLEQIDVTANVLGNAVNFLKDGMDVELKTANSKVIGAELPPTVVLEVTFLEPGVKGAIVNDVPKPAILETGLEVLVPVFVNQGDFVLVDTSTNEYLEIA